jgi:hypothetical protein
MSLIPYVAQGIAATLDTGALFVSTLVIVLGHLGFCGNSELVVHGTSTRSHGVLVHLHMCISNGFCHGALNSLQTIPMLELLCY